MHRTIVTALAGAGLALGLAATGAAAETFLVDLTHPLGTFAPKEGSTWEADLTKPYKGSEAVPTFGAQVVYERTPDFKTNQGHFALGRFAVGEHHGTHIDTPMHFQNNEATMEVRRRDNRTLELLTPEDLIGRIVFIDISSRVQAELDRNGGVASPDKAKTDFSEATNNVVTPQDINTIADQLDNNVWIVVNAGWSRFFKNPDFAKTPYFNGWNFPGVSKAACDRIIEIEDGTGIRINGIAMDNIGIDTGESGAGDEGNLVVNSFYCHVRGLQRGWKFVENAANLGQLAEADPGSCDLIVGALKLVNGTGTPARVMAQCKR
jgi:kynurenine formamidase